MKSKLLKTIFGLSLFALTVNVNATIGSEINSVVEGDNKADAIVTVGEVATPVYSVAVSWDDLTFDWAYDYENNKFGWKPKAACVPAEIKDGMNFDSYFESGSGVYSDSTCGEYAEEYVEGTDYYTFESRKSAIIHIADESENGQIVPSIKWNPSDKSDKYQDVVGKFQYRENNGTCTLVESQEMFDYIVAVNETYKFYSDVKCYSELDTIPEKFEASKYYVKTYPLVTLRTEEISSSVMDYWEYDFFGKYDIHKPIGVNSAYKYYTLAFNLEGGSITPTAGDEIGTITISIRAK